MSDHPCPYCGETARQDGRCAGCGLTPGQAPTAREIALRHAEHHRRARLVVDATKHMPMVERIRVAKHLLGDLAPLPSGEAWDKQFRQWQGPLSLVDHHDEEDR